MNHPYRLRPYHNPQAVDESRVPAGWRFLYEGEFRHAPIARCWLSWKDDWTRPALHIRGCPLPSWMTFIIPVDA